jgi:hypothetical protein
MQVVLFFNICIKKKKENSFISIWLSKAMNRYSALVSLIEAKRKRQKLKIKNK